MKKVFLYLSAPTLVLAIFTIIFQLWKVDLTQPAFDYEGDSLFSIFVVRTIIETGWIFSNPSVGFPYEFVLHDFPIHTDFSNFLLLKFFSYFSSNPFLIVNLFFIASFALVALSAFYVLRSFSISYFTSLIFATLYSFASYHLMRSVAHLSLSNYFLAPLVIMVAIWIANEEIEVISRNKKQCLTVSNNKKLLATFLISVIAATNGIYYAFFSIIIFILALLLAYLKKGKLITARSVVVPIFIILIATIVLYLNLPSSVYWLKHGPSHLASRTPYESELFALRINSLLLPVANHYLDCLANIRDSFNNLTTQNDESGAESLGIIGSIGLLFLFFWTIFSNRSEENSVFQKILKKFSLDSKDQNFISDLAALNISLILFFTSGGLIMFFAIKFPHIRSHARISIFISFICLTAIALLCDKIRQKNYRLTTAVFLTLFAFGIFDQVGRISIGSGNPHSLIIQSDEMKKRFNYDKTFFSDVEKSLPQKSAIFIFPVQNFPEGKSYHSLTPYLHSKNLLWSFPTITRRENSIWQQSYYKKNFKEFFGEMKKFNFSAVVIDHKLYIGNKDLTVLAKLEAQLGSQIKKPPILSQNGDWAFYQIK